MAGGASLGGIGRAFKSRNFRIFWLGQVNLGIGAWVYRLAIAWLTWELTRSTAWLGIIAASYMAPVLLLCPFFGVTADRIGHLRQLVYAIALTGLSGLAPIVLIWSGHLTIELLVATTLVNGVSRALSIPSRHALLPALVEPGLLSAAIGVNSATHHGANFVGPALGGALMAAFGAEAALGYFVFGAGVAVGMLPLLRLARGPVRSGTRASMLADLAEGFRYTVRHPGIRLVILMVAVMALCIQPYLEMLAGVADEVHHMGKDGLALLATASGLGAMAGGLWIAWRGRTEGLGRIMLAAVLVGLVGLAVFGLSSVLWLTLPALFLCGISIVVGSTCASSLIQNSVEPALRARVMAFDSMIAIGAPALGAVIIGWAGTRLGIQIPLAAAAFVGLAAWLALSRSVRREMRGLEAPRAPAGQSAR